MNPLKLGKSQARLERVKASRQNLVPRSSYPSISVVSLHSGPLAKLAWIFGGRDRVRGK